jgi:hypothetical protein
MPMLASQRRSVEQRRPRVKDKEYLAWIRSFSCLLCGENTSVEAIHVRLGDPRVDKRETGMGEKSDDRPWTLPLCGRHHRLQHRENEKQFWEQHGINPISACLALALAYRNENREDAERIIRAHQNRFL